MFSKLEKTEEKQFLPLFTCTNSYKKKITHTHFFQRMCKYRVTKYTLAANDLCMHIAPVSHSHTCTLNLVSLSLYPPPLPPNTHTHTLAH